MFNHSEDIQYSDKYGHRLSHSVYDILIILHILSAVHCYIITFQWLVLRIFWSPDVHVKSRSWSKTSWEALQDWCSSALKRYWLETLYVCLEEEQNKSFQSDTFQCPLKVCQKESEICVWMGEGDLWQTAVCVCSSNFHTSNTIHIETPLHSNWKTSHNKCHFLLSFSIKSLVYDRM